MTQQPTGDAAEQGQANEEAAGDQDAGPASMPTGAAADAGEDTAEITAEDQDAGPASTPEQD